MNKALQILVSICLVLNGTGALYGGYHLIMHPDGSSLGLPLSLLEHSPFHNFLIPGIILLVFNGIFSLAIFAALLMKTKNFALMVTAQGLILILWIVIQTMLIQSADYLHLIFGGIGLILLVSGILLKKDQKSGRI